jgi:cell division septation protein DedD
VTDQATDKAGRYYIQVGIFTHTPDSAFLEHLRVSGYGYKVRRVLRDKHPLTQVLVGPFSTHANAKNTLPDTQALFNPGAFIVPLASL